MRTSRIPAARSAAWPGLAVWILATTLAAQVADVGLRDVVAFSGYVLAFLTLPGTLL